MTNSFPTVLNPWYVLLKYTDHPGLGGVVFYKNIYDEDPEDTTDDPNKAALFMHLGSAARIAKDNSWLVVVLYDREQLKDYGRD